MQNRAHAYAIGETHKGTESCLGKCYYSGVLTVIYALVDPRDGVTRYVGKTTDPYGRMVSHLSDRDPSGTPKQRWMHDLREMRLRPRLVVLDAVPAGPDPSGAERRWTDHHAGTLLNGPRELALARRHADKAARRREPQPGRQRPPIVHPPA